jgi:glycosyltransferase involved in cell wall biosynthesis
LFERELAGRGDDYIDLLKKHPLTFITLARQVQSELIAGAFASANAGELDIVHIYTNEEDIALPFAQFCKVPVVFTHHDPFNFLIRHKNVFPKYKHLNWLSISYAQRAGMPTDTNWIANIYHGVDTTAFKPEFQPIGRNLAFLGRIIEPKGVHVAIEAVKRYNRSASPDKKYTLKIAGKHYAGHRKDKYWHEVIEPQIDGQAIEYVGFVQGDKAKREFLAAADALIVPSTFEEPFGMVMIEALACGTPVIGLDSGAIPEVVSERKTGFVVASANAVAGIAEALAELPSIDRRTCRAAFEARFTLERMCAEHIVAYRSLIE